MTTKTTWTISELAHEFSITPRTIRFYEDQGIVSPGREGRNRVYLTRDRTRLKLALRGKRLGLQLSEILSLIDMYDGPGDTIPQLRHYMSVLAQHRDMLEQQRRDLDLTLNEIAQQQGDCEVLLKQRLEAGKPL
ncbi:MAG: MerR family DNA-binding transcriptional regulator [Burkholderiaceae bacterium]|nr:MerR family DNA-binding transcriptional regulator [Burkholderiaceae bacterium]